MPGVTESFTVVVDRQDDAGAWLQTTPAQTSFTHWPLAQPPAPHGVSELAYAHAPFAALHAPGTWKVRTLVPTQTAPGGWAQVTPRQGFDLHLSFSQSHETCALA